MTHIRSRLQHEDQLGHQYCEPGGTMNDYLTGSDFIDCSADRA
jgi:hypothetical protein